MPAHMSKHSKPNKRSTQAPSPNPEQVAALRRLIDSGNGAEAKRRLQALCKSFPTFKPLYALAWEVEDRFGLPSLATARALEWQRASPNSRAALEAVCQSARRADLNMLYARALNRMLVMDGEVEVVLPPYLDNPLGALLPEQAEAIDLSRMHMDDGNPAAAIAVLQGVDHPSARNNLARALFADGQVPQALAVAEANWQATPHNLFALDCVVRWRCWLRGMDACLGLKAPLLHTVPLRIEDAAAQVQALRFLGDEEAVATVSNRAKQADFWSRAPLAVRSEFNQLCSAEAEWAGDSSVLFPLRWVNAHHDLVKQRANFSEQEIAQRRAAIDAACDAHPDYLVCTVQMGNELSTLLAATVLIRRAKNADAAALTALAALTGLLASGDGPDSVRTDLLHWMTEEGLAGKDAPVDIWLNGCLQTVRSHGMEISGEPLPSPFPPDGEELYDRMLAAMRRKDWSHALDIGMQLHRMYPHVPSPLSNMAAVKEAQGQPLAEIMALYRQAHALNPDYLFARCGLARCLAAEGKVDEARELLATLMQRKKFHVSEARSFLRTQRAVAAAAGDEEAARNLDQAIASLEADG